uniref:Malic enzyme n=1 Tax=Hadrurus spadix TaxID=141984 RepID=A0A1W7RA80_9SCOR
MGLNNQAVKCMGCEKCGNMATQKRGVAYLREARTYKGLAFSRREREKLHLQGLLPSAIRTAELQVEIVMKNLDLYSDDFSRYIYLRDLQDNNEQLFYKVMANHTERLMPLVYTPVVGYACQNYSLIFRRPRGLFISIEDSGHIEEILSNWPEPNVQAIVVTDGERILGLGDLGANGMGIPVGKLALYTSLSGLSPHLTLPVTLDVGTNNEKLLKDPYYIGLREKRVTGAKYDALIDEFMKAVKKQYGRYCLIQFEDFANNNAFRLLEKYKDSYCTFNDDIQGTASVAIAGIFASMKITGQKLSQNTFLFLGAGEAALGTSDLIVMALQKEGLSKEEAVKKVWMIDSRGLIVKDRPSGGITEHKAIYAKEFKHLTDLEEVVKQIKPTALIGASAQPGVFTEKVLRAMQASCERPIIFALSNPTDKAECTAEAAYKHTDGKCIFASGSPFDPVIYNGKTYHPGQGNNAYIFPAVGMAVTSVNVPHVSEEVFLVAAKALADQVTQQHMDEGRVYPPLPTIHDVSLNVAAKLVEYFYREGIAALSPEPKDKLSFLKTKQYNYNYPEIQQNSLPFYAQK